MLTCISRRACADRYDFRLTNSKGEIGKHIWTEYRCPNAVSKENEICTECSVKLPKYKYQASPKCNHGQIGGAYHPDSKLYGSAYYLAELKCGWFPSEADELRAKAAVDKANSNMAPRKKAVQVAEPVPEPVAVQVAEPVAVQVAEPVAVAVPTKRKYVRKTPEQKAAEKEKVPRARKEKKTEVLLPEVPIVENPLEPKFVEVAAPPITITDFVVVKVKKIKCQGKDYYYDSSSGKVYGVSVNGVGDYKGRFKEEDNTIDTTFPDSDCE